MKSFSSKHLSGILLIDSDVLDTKQLFFYKTQPSHL